MGVSENRIPPKIRCLVILLAISVEAWRYATFYRSDPRSSAAREDPVPMIGGSALEDQAHQHGEFWRHRVIWKKLLFWFHVVTCRDQKGLSFSCFKRHMDGGSSGSRLRRCFQHTFHIIFPSSFWNPHINFYTFSWFSITFHHFSIGLAFF